MMSAESGASHVTVLFRSAHMEVEDGLPFADVMYAVRARLSPDSPAARALAEWWEPTRLPALHRLVPISDDRRWNRAAVVAVVLQSLLIGAADDERQRWSAAFAALLDDLSDTEWAAAVDGVVANHADALLSRDTMRRAVECGAVSLSTLDFCCRALAAAALGRGDVDEAIWAVDRSATPFALVAGFVETRSMVDREALVALYAEVERVHRAAAAHPTMAAAHRLLLGEPDVAASLLPAAADEARERPDRELDWVVALVALLVGESAFAGRIASGAGDSPSPVLGWIRARGVSDPRQRAMLLRRCLRGDRVLGGLESRLWFEIAVAEQECGRREPARTALRVARERRAVGVFDGVGFDPRYGQLADVLAMVAVTEGELLSRQSSAGERP